MAKKRTTIPFYGKKNQRLEANAFQASRQGNTEMFNYLMQLSSDIFYTKRKAAGFPVPKGWTPPEPQEAGV